MKVHQTNKARRFSPLMLISFVMARPGSDLFIQPERPNPLAKFYLKPRHIGNSPFITAPSIRLTDIGKQTSLLLELAGLDASHRSESQLRASFAVSLFGNCGHLLVRRDTRPTPLLDLSDAFNLPFVPYRNLSRGRTGKYSNGLLLP